MLSYEWDEGEPLSARGDDSTGLVSERRNHTLLRPIYINAVEVGYTNARKIPEMNLPSGEAVALLPYCFRTYPAKTSSWPELMALFKMNLIEFTPGYGREKYIEVNRILANRAEDTGGCIVARSQMHNIIEERPTLVRTVEKRLLMPSFNHNDILFPLDGPLGRCGPSLRSTLECPLSDPDWPRCSVQQMLLRDQRLWLTKLCALVPDQVTWCTLLHAVVSFKPSIPLPAVKLPPRCLTHANRRVYPPETNPVDGRGYSYARGLSQRFGHDKFGRSLREFPVTGRPCARELQRRYGMEHPLEVYRPNVPRSGQSERSQDEFLPDYLRPPKDILDEEPHFLAEKPLPKPNYLGNPDSIYRLLPRKSGSDGRSETSTAGSCSPSHHHYGCSKKMCPCEGVKVNGEKPHISPNKAKCRSTVSEEFCLDHLGPTYATEYVGYSATSDWPSEALLTNEEKCVITLSQIFGWRKAIRVVRNNPRVRVVNRLVDFALVEPDEADDDKPGEDILNYAELVDLLKAAKAPSSVVPHVDEREENLIDLPEDLISATNATAPDDTVVDSLSESLSNLNLDLTSR